MSIDFEGNDYLINFDIFIPLDNYVVPSLIFGTQGDDTLTGTQGDDIIFGEDGNDYLIGKEGNDTLINTSGTVDGGEGTDTLRANYSMMNNGAGIHVGYMGEKRIFSRLDGSVLQSYRNIEKFEIIGTQYADVLQGSWNDDFLNGIAGDDDISGDAGNDYLDGGTGNDTLNGGAGDDALYGGDDNDLLIETEGNVDGGAGTDTLKADYSSFDNGAGVYVGYLGQNQIASLATNTSILNYSNVEHFEITGTKYADILSGSASNDSLNGGAGNDELRGQAGNDILDGGTGDDTLNGDDGNDNLNGGAGNDTLDGGTGDDTVVYAGNYTEYEISLLSNGDLQVIDRNSTNGDEGTDILTGVEQIQFTQGETYRVVTDTAGNNVLSAPSYSSLLFGGGGNDSMTAGAGHDRLDGGDGNDTLIGGDGNDTLIGGSGNDTVIYAGFDHEISFLSNGDLQFINWNKTDGDGSTDILSGVEEIKITQGGTYRVVTGTAGNNVLTAPSYSSLMFGDAGNDSMIGGAGNDTLYGFTGNDTVIGGAGEDTAVYAGNYTEYGISLLSNGDLLFIDRDSSNGNEGTDILTGVEQIKFIQGGTHRVVTGTAANDMLTASSNSSLVFGGGGDDDIGSSSGNDYLDGGDGNDYLYTGSGNDTLIGGADTDTAIYFGTMEDYSISLLSNGDLQVIDRYITNGKVGIDILSGVEAIQFTDYGETYGVFTGTAGNDVLTAPISSSLLFGGGGNDNLTGSSSNDNLVGGLGNDTLTGGFGADQFVFNSIGEGIDTIKDFSAQQEDKIQIIGSSFGATSTSQFTYNNNTGALLFNGQQFATLENKPDYYSIIFNIEIV